MTQTMAVLKEDVQSPFEDDLTLLARTTAADADEAVRNAVESADTEVDPEFADGEEFHVWTGVTPDEETVVTYQLE